MAKEKLVEVGAKAALKAKRSAFKNIIKMLESEGERSALGFRTSAFGNSRFVPGSAVLAGPVRASDMGTRQLDPLRSILSQRMADPTPVVEEALSTGRLAGRKLSSNQRRQLAEASALQAMEREAVEGLDNSAFYYNPSVNGRGLGFTEVSKTGVDKSRRASSLLASKLNDILYKVDSPLGRQKLGRGLYDLGYNKTENIESVLDDIVRASDNPELAREAENVKALARIRDELPGYYSQNYAYKKPMAILGQKERLRGMAESTGIDIPRGYKSSTTLGKLRDALILIGDNPRAAETAKVMYKEWEGTAEELANMAKLLSL